MCCCGLSLRSGYLARAEEQGRPRVPKRGRHALQTAPCKLNGLSNALQTEPELLEPSIKAVHTGSSGAQFKQALQTHFAVFPGSTLFLGRPNLTPRAFAAAMPAFVRSEISSRSYSAIVAINPNCSRPSGVSVSMPSVIDPFCFETISCSETAQNSGSIFDQSIAAR